MPETYLDHAASSPLRPEALEAISGSLAGTFANPSSIHALGQQARKSVEAARAQVARLVGADVSETIFTSGATEANNLAIRGVIEPVLAAGAPVHAVTTALEHPSVMRTFEALEKRGLSLTVVAPGADGVVRAADVLAAVRPETALVSVIAVSNELGTVQPIEEIGRGVGPRLRGGGQGDGGGNKVIFHVDAVQALVSTELDFKKTHADLMTVSAHKIGGPKGVGALVVKRGTGIEPILTGGGHERGLRAGTENVPGIVGFGAAAEALIASRAGEILRYRELRAAVESKLPSGVTPLVPAEASAPHVLALECRGKTNDWIVLLLSREGVMAAAGSACKAGERGASDVVRSLGLDETRGVSVIRVSFGWSTERKDAEVFLGALGRAMAR